MVDMFVLTKSKYRLWLQCHRRLWYEYHNPKPAFENVFALLGNQAHEVAREVVIDELLNERKRLLEDAVKTNDTVIIKAIQKSIAGAYLIKAHVNSCYNLL